MKLPSIQQVVRESARTFRRFPFVLIAATVWTVATLLIIDHEGPATASILFPVMFASILGFPLLLTFALMAEWRSWSKSATSAVQVVCVLLLVAYGLIVPANMTHAPELHVQRLLALTLSLCLLLAAAPLAAIRNLNDYWHFVRLLLQRVIIAGVFSGTLFAGLAAAMGSIDLLFGVDIPGKRYGELWTIIVGIFATWFFLSDVPGNPNGLEARSTYPRVVRIFGQYILSPMLLVYFVILYAYVAKIAIQWSWPQGLVGRTIFGFAAIGIVAYLLLYPIRDKGEFSWIKSGARWFWIGMIPMAVVLELALWRRVSEYGITESRYLGVVLGVWLAAMSLYFLVSKSRNIRVLPVSICLIGLLISFGPWGMFSVSERSQVSRLAKQLTEYSILTDGKVHPVPHEVFLDDAEEMNSILWYLNRTHGYDEIQPWFNTALTIDSAEGGPFNITPDSVLGLLGIDYRGYPKVLGSDFGELRADELTVVDISGYNHLTTLRVPAEVPEPVRRDSGLVVTTDTRLDALTARVIQDGTPIDSIRISLQPFVTSLVVEYGHSRTPLVPAERMAIDTATETMSLKVILRTLRYRSQDENVYPESYDAIILYSHTDL